MKLEPTLYDWSKAPAWASHAAMDRDGHGMWFDKYPYKIGGGWIPVPHNGYYGVMDPEAIWKLTRFINWEESVEQRPMTLDEFFGSTAPEEGYAPPPEAGTW